MNLYSQNESNIQQNDILLLKKDEKTLKFACYNSKGKKVLGDYLFANDKYFKKFAIVSDPSPVIIDRKGTHVYNIFVFDNGVDYESEGLIRIIKNGKIGFVDSKNYELIIKPQFKCAYPFKEGKSRVSHECDILKDGEYSTWKSAKWFYINKKGGKL